jgi:flagellar biogenesis protein FliO
MWKWVLLIAVILFVVWIFEKFIKWIKKKEKGENDD